MKLPPSEDLRIAELAQVFNKKSSTYKYYWFLALIESIEENKIEIPKKDLFIKMLAIPWYTVNYFKLSFGSQDVIHDTIEKITVLEDIPITNKKSTIEYKLKNSTNRDIFKTLFHFDKNVPHWFLSPWYRKKTKSEIYNLSKNFTNDPLYALFNEKIVINPKWVPYIKIHAKFLKEFCYWNLTLFLQVRNPNVPDIPNKLIRPAKRNSLTKQRNQYWNKYLKIKKVVPCIFTGKNIDSSNYCLDHFIPYAFVSHDLIWNLIPIDPGFNSRKSDKLPILDYHYQKFFNLQKDAYFTLSQDSTIKKFKEEYHTVFPVIKDQSDFSFERFRDVISPLVTTAHNNGFEFLHNE